jgi:hypothetical protein
MTTRQILDLVEKEFPQVSGREAIIYLSNAILDYTNRTRITPKIVLAFTTDGSEVYQFADMRSDQDFANYRIEVDRVYLNSNEIPHESANAMFEEWVYNTDGNTIAIFKKSGNDVVTYNVVNSNVEIVANTLPKPIEKDTDVIPIPEYLHMGVLYKTKMFAAETTNSVALYQVYAQQYEYYIREGLKQKNERGRSGSYNIKFHDY